MSTPSVQPISNPVTTSASAQTWLQAHESLIGKFLLAGFLFFGVYKAFDLAGKYEDHRVQLATATLTAQKQKDDVVLQQAQVTLQSYQQALQTATQQNASLTTAIASRNTQIVLQQKTDAALPPSELAQRWNSLAGTTGVQNTQNGYALTNDAALDTIDLIEQVPVLKQNVSDLTTQVSNDKNALDSANSLISQGKTLIAGLQAANADEVKQCTAHVADVKAQARKGKLKAFFIGLVTGFVGGKIW